MRTPVFELHILPMMRASDREHMLFKFDLWDYDAVVAHSAEIANRIRVDMPTIPTGGPWPEEWVALFDRWRAEGFKRLELGIATYNLSEVNNRFVITGSGTKPGAKHRAWLQLDAETAIAKTYVLYVEAPHNPSTNTPTAFTVRERYPATDTRTVFVRDAAGTHEVLLAPAPPAIESIANATDRAFWRLDDE